MPRVPVVGLRYGLGIILSAAAVGVISKADVGAPPTVIVVLPIVLGAAAYAIHRRRPAPAVA